MYTSIEDVKQAVEENQGVLSLRMEVLLNACVPGAKNCSSGNVYKILCELSEQNLNCIPPQLIGNKNAIVRIYEIDSPASYIVDAVFHPGRKNDDIIRCASLLEQVRELLCG